jgi:hypothetical protein
MFNYYLLFLFIECVNAMYRRYYEDKQKSYVK